MAADLVSALAARPGLLSDLRGQFTGKQWAANMGKALGVSPRTAQRWYTTGKEQRKPSQAVKEKAAVLTPKPLTVRIHGEFCISNDCRTRGVNFHLRDAASARQFNQELLAGGEAAALDYLYSINSFEPDSVTGATYEIR